MTHITCKLTAKNRDQLRNPTFGNRAWATFTPFLYVLRNGDVTNACVILGRVFLGSEAFNRASRMGFSCPIYTASQTRQDSPVCVVSGAEVWIGQLLLTCSDFKFSRSATVLSCRESSSLAEADTTQTRHTVSSCPAGRCVGEREKFIYHVRTQRIHIQVRQW